MTSIMIMTMVKVFRMVMTGLTAYVSRERDLTKTHLYQVSKGVVSLD